MGRRSDNPMAILALGLLAVAFFGGTIVYFNDRTPVLQLRTHLRDTFQFPGVQTRFVRGVAGESPHVLVVLPAESEADANLLRRIGVSALERYREVAKGTRVERCVVKVAQRDPAEAQWVSLEQVTHFKHAENMRSKLRDELRNLHLSPELEVAGYAKSGVHLEVRSPCAERDRSPEARRRTARLAVEALARYPFVGQVTLILQEGQRDALRATGGRDVSQPEQRLLPAPAGGAAKRGAGRPAPSPPGRKRS